MNKKCLGCGINLQSENELAKGYVKDIEMDYCMRCFRLKHYHEKSDIKFFVDNQKIVDSVNNENGFVFFFVDVLNIYQETINLFKKITKPKILVISKIDVLGKDISLNVIKNWLNKYFKITEEIIFIKNSFTSANKILNIIENKKEKEFYFLGITNAGKSTILNRLIENLENKKNVITVSEMPNTTLDFINIYLPNNKIIKDSVGLSYHYCFEDYEFMQKTKVHNAIKAKNYYLKPESFLNIEDRIYVKIANLNSVTFYGSNGLEIKKEYNKKLDNPIIIEVQDKTNIYLKGIGFLYFKNKEQVTIYGINKDNIAVESSFLGGNFYE